jgi:hypothetical protein
MPGMQAEAAERVNNVLVGAMQKRAAAVVASPDGSKLIAKALYVRDSAAVEAVYFKTWRGG